MIADHGNNHWQQTTKSSSWKTFYQRSIRELISVAIDRDTFEKWLLSQADLRRFVHESHSFADRHEKSAIAIPISFPCFPASMKLA